MSAHVALFFRGAPQEIFCLRAPLRSVSRLRAIQVERHVTWSSSGRELSLFSSNYVNCAEYFINSRECGITGSSVAAKSSAAQNAMTSSGMLSAYLDYILAILNGQRAEKGMYRRIRAPG